MRKRFTLVVKKPIRSKKEPSTFFRINLLWLNMEYLFRLIYSTYLVEKDTFLYLLNFNHIPNEFLFKGNLLFLLEGGDEELRFNLVSPRKSLAILSIFMKPYM